MLLDPRIEKLAYNLVNYSCDVQKGENVFIEATGVDYQLVNCLMNCWLIFFCFLLSLYL